MMEWFANAEIGLRMLLLVCGAFIVFVIGLFSWWAARSSHEAPRPHERNGRREPMFESPRLGGAGGSLDAGMEMGKSIPVSAPGRDGGERRTRHGGGEKPATRASGPGVRKYPPGVSKVIDYVVTLAVEEPLNRARFSEIFAALPSSPVMPVRVYGLHPDDAHGWRQLHSSAVAEAKPLLDAWASPAHAEDGAFSDEGGGAFTELVFAMQLADQKQVAAAADIAALHETVNGAASGIGGRVESNVQQNRAVENCETLRGLARRIEPNVTINILAAGTDSFNGAHILEVATEFGLALGKMDIFHKATHVEGEPVTLFSMANFFVPGSFEVDSLSSMNTRGLLLFMNVPQTPNPAGVFNTMSVVAKSMCRRLGGRLVSDEREPLHQEQIDQVRNAILQACSQMQRSGVVPGSEDARRLFA